MIRALPGQKFVGATFAAVLLLLPAMVTAVEYQIDPANSNNGLFDIYSATFDPPLNPGGDPFFGGTPPATREITIVPTPTGALAAADTTLCVQNFNPAVPAPPIVPPCTTLYPMATPSSLDLTLSAGNTQLAINGGNVFFPNLTINISGNTDVIAEGASMVSFAASPGTVPISGSGVAVIEVDTQPSTAVDFATFTEIVTSCTGPLCALIPILTLDMVRYRLTIDWDATFTSFTADFIGQTANNSMVFATLDSVVPAPDITVTDSVSPVDDLQIPYGNVVDGNFVDAIVTVTNDGNADLILGQITQPAAPFSVLNDMCSNQTLTPATDCTITVRFEPNATGAFVSSFDIPSNDPDQSNVTVDVAGTGVSPAITVVDSVPPGNDLDIPFGDVTVNPATPPDETITVSNSGTADLMIGPLTAPVAPFSLSNDTCSNRTLAPTENCSATVSFAPTSADPFNSILDIPSNDPDDPTTTVTLSGVGTASLLPRIAVSNSPVIFGNVTAGTSVDQIVTVRSAGPVDLTIGPITPPAAPFSIANDACSNQVLIPTATCDVVVRFSPAGAGMFNDSFTISSDDPNNANATVDITGTGVVPEITVTDSIAPIDDLRLPFGDVTETLSVDASVTVTNNGVVDLTLGQITIADPSGAFSILTDNCAAPQNVIGPGNSCTIDVGFTPPAIGDFSGSLDIPSDDPATPTSTVDLDGSGTSGPAPDISVTDTVPPEDDLDMDFGNVTESTAWHRTVTIANDGNGNLVMGMIGDTDPLSGTFSILSDDCSAQIIAPATSCEVDIRFLPIRVDTFRDSFDIPSNDPDEPSLTFRVSGSGVAVGTGTIGLNPEGADSGFFGSALRPLTVFTLISLVLVTARHRYKRHTQPTP
jgi:hypothetical protein